MQRLAILAVLAVAASAEASDAELALRIEPPIAPSDRGPPELVASIAPCPETRDLTLGVGAWRAPVQAIKRWRESGEPLALAIVVAGQEIAMGNDEIEPPDDPEQMPGLYAPLVEALNRAKLADVAPIGSLGALVTYAAGAKLRLPLGPIAALDGSALGGQRDYYRQIGSDLVVGVERGLLLLAAAQPRQRALIVIGDGNDTNNEAARRALRDLAATAARDHIEVFAIIYRGPLSAEGNVITELVPDARIVTSGAAIPDALAAIVSRLGDRCVATFSADGLRTGTRTTEFVLRAGGRAIATVHVPFAGYEPRGGTRWPALVVGGAGLIGLAIGVGALMRRRARATAPPGAASPS